MSGATLARSRRPGGPVPFPKRNTIPQGECAELARKVKKERGLSPGCPRKWGNANPCQKRTGKAAKGLGGGPLVAGSGTNSPAEKGKSGNKFLAGVWKIVQMKSASLKGLSGLGGE